jgi:hypothetical protein
MTDDDGTVDVKALVERVTALSGGLASGRMLVAWCRCPPSCGREGVVVALERAFVGQRTAVLRWTRSVSTCSSFLLDLRSVLEESKVFLCSQLSPGTGGPAIVLVARDECPAAGMAESPVDLPEFMREWIGGGTSAYVRVVELGASRARRPEPTDGARVREALWVLDGTCLSAADRNAQCWSALWGAVRRDSPGSKPWERGVAHELRRCCGDDAAGFVDAWRSTRSRLPAEGLEPRLWRGLSDVTFVRVVAEWMGTIQGDARRSVMERLGDFVAPEGDGGKVGVDDLVRIAAKCKGDVPEGRGERFARLLGGAWAFAQAGYHTDDYEPVDEYLLQAVDRALSTRLEAARVRLADAGLRSTSAASTPG